MKGVLIVVGALVAFAIPVAMIASLFASKDERRACEDAGGKYTRIESGLDFLPGAVPMFVCRK